MAAGGRPAAGLPQSSRARRPRAGEGAPRVRRRRRSGGADRRGGGPSRPRRLSRPPGPARLREPTRPVWPTAPGSARRRASDGVGPTVRVEQGAACLLDHDHGLVEATARDVAEDDDERAGVRRQLVLRGALPRGSVSDRVGHATPGAAEGLPEVPTAVSYAALRSIHSSSVVDVDGGRQPVADLARRRRARPPPRRSARRPPRTSRRRRAGPPRRRCGRGPAGGRSARSPARRRRPAASSRPERRPRPQRRHERRVPGERRGRVADRAVGGRRGGSAARSAAQRRGRRLDGVELGLAGVDRGLEAAASRATSARERGSPVLAEHADGIGERLRGRRRPRRGRARSPGRPPRSARAAAPAGAGGRAPRRSPPRRARGRPRPRARRPRRAMRRTTEPPDYPPRAAASRLLLLLRGAGGTGARPPFCAERSRTRDGRRRAARRCRGRAGGAGPSRPGRARWSASAVPATRRISGTGIGTMTRRLPIARATSAVISR